MSLPPFSLRRQGLSWIARWDREAVVVRFDHVRQGRDGWHAEVSVSDALGATGDGHLAWGRENLSSALRRQQLAKSLAEQTGERVPWGRVLELSYLAVVAAARRGEPAEAITAESAAGLPDEQPHLLRPLMPIGLGNTTSVHGPGGSSKSYLALAVGLSLASGSTVVPGLVPVERGPALFLDYETDRDTFARRVRRVARGANLPQHVAVHYRRCRLPLTDEVAAVAEVADQLGAVAVVLDSVERACGQGGDYADPNRRILALYEALDLIPGTKLLVDHVNRAEAANSSATFAYGSIFKANAARSVWELRRSEASSGPDIYLTLRHVKVNDGPLREPIGLRVEHQPDRTVFHEAAAARELLEGQSAPARVLALLERREEPLGPSEAASELGLNYGAVQKALRRLEQEGRAVQVARGRYLAGRLESDMSEVVRGHVH